MTSSRELYYQQMLLEPDWQRPLIAHNNRRAYKEIPPSLSIEECARHAAEDAEMRDRFERRNENPDLNYNP